ncbi:MAG TPA: hypothetical protein DEP84_33180 [Chloroflexi bacterium]|nr:hypothetical protein [Chloroflexota bacterium]
MTPTRRATPPSPAEALTRDAQEQVALLEAFLVTTQHCFGAWATLFAPVQDPRVPHRITYPLVSLLFSGTLLFLCRLGSRRQVTHRLRRNGAAAALFQALFGVATCPHGDTLNATFSRLDPDQGQAVVTDLGRTLIRKKVLDRYRLLGRYFVIAIDGTGRLTFPKRHCPHCLTVTHHGQTTYYHPVLEAKLVCPNGLIISLLTEFVETAGENPTKQDCELTAFSRLAKRLKQAFPRLPICLSLDGLFAGGPTMTICEDYGWKYLITLQQDDIPYLNQEFAALWPLASENSLRLHTGPQNEIQQDYRWVNDITSVDSKDQTHTVGVLEGQESTPRADGTSQTTRFKWITNFTLRSQGNQKYQAIDLANHGGRIRWKIENAGFNVQKNGGFNLEHASTRDPVASKIFYFLLQIAHLLAQLIEKGSLFRQAFPAGVGSAKNLAFRLLEAWRNRPLSATQIQDMLQIRRQIRFAPP